MSHFNEVPGSKSDCFARSMFRLFCTFVLKYFDIQFSSNWYATAVYAVDNDHLL